MTSHQRLRLFQLLFSIGLSFTVSACSLYSSEETTGKGAAAPPPPPPEKVVTAAPAAPSPIDTLRALSPPEGLRFTPLFSGKSESTDVRLRRLEDAVQDIRNDVDTVVPAVVRMATIEKDNKAVALQQPSLAPPAAAPTSLVSPQSSAMAAPVNPAPQQQSAAAPPPAPSSPAAPALGNVKDVRIADHADKTRIVLDMTVKYNGAIRLDNNGKELVIPLQQLNWLGPKSFDASSYELVSGYHVANDNLYIDLMYPSQIKAQDIIPPEGGIKDYRAVIDLFSHDVHK